MTFSLAFLVELMYYIYNMYKNRIYKVLRIVFCALTVALAAAAIFVFVYAPNIWWGVATVMLAFVFGALMVTFKGLQEQEEKKKDPPPPTGDFIYGKVKENKDNEEDKK